MITSGGVLRNGSNTFTKVASGQGEIQSASIVTPGAVPLTYTPLQGGVAVYSAAKSTFTGDVGWVKIVWIYQARLPLEGTTSLANPTLP